jgi:hypothetical protein
LSAVGISHLNASGGAGLMPARNLLHTRRS